MSPTTRVRAASRMRAHARWEIKLLLRNGEQLLLMFVIPVALLVGLEFAGSGWLGTSDAVPTVLAVSVMATAFTSLAIGTGFERRSGALEYLGTTPLTRIDLLVGKLLATFVLTCLSMGSIVLVGVLLGWEPRPSWTAAVLVTASGCLALGSWAIALAGLLRAEAVLALANGLFVLLVMFGGVVVPPASMPSLLGAIASSLPSGALADGLRESLGAASWPLVPIGVLLAWAVAGALLARRTFRWEP